MSRKKLKCVTYKCQNPPYMAGLCKEHYDASERTSIKREIAIQGLHSGLVNGEPINQEELREEFYKIQEWWNRACSSLRSGILDDVLGDEAEYAMEWCIGLAQEIIDAEKIYVEGQSLPLSLISTRRWVWSRFENLEAGLRSNGTKRSKN